MEDWLADGVSWLLLLCGTAGGAFWRGEFDELGSAVEDNKGEEPGPRKPSRSDQRFRFLCLPCGPPLVLLALLSSLCDDAVEAGVLGDPSMASGSALSAS